MNMTIDNKTAKTIEIMNEKIGNMDASVSHFFDRMSDALNILLEEDEVYLAAVAPHMELTVITLEEAPDILPCFDETDRCFDLSMDGTVAGIYDPRQVLEVFGDRYLTGPVIFARINSEGDFTSLLAGDLYQIQQFLEECTTHLMAGRKELIAIRRADEEVSD